MLNRKMSDYLYYGSLVAIIAIVVLIRVVTLNNLNAKIDSLQASNVNLQDQIDTLEESVEENKDVQTDRLYELYDVVPGIFNATELTYKTVSILESLGINESDDTQRTIFVKTNPGFVAGSEFNTISEEYLVVEVQVYFNTNDADVISDLVDAIYNQEQMFILKDISYTTPDGEDFIGVTLNFFAIYDAELIEESQ